MSDDIETKSDPSSSTPQTIRRVSIVEISHGCDNSAFEIPKITKLPPNNDEIEPIKVKGILHNSNNLLQVHGEDIKKFNGESKRKKHSLSSSVYSKHSKFSEVEEENRAWWYTFCLKCRSDDETLSWEPNFWSKFCHYPCCLTYRQFSRFTALILIGLFSWIVFFSIVGETATPGGHLFQLILLTISAYLGGCLMAFFTDLPKLTGMLTVGIVFQNLEIVDINDSFSTVTKELRDIALVIILVKAGLDLDPAAMKRLKVTVLKLGLGPWCVEAVCVCVLSHFFLDLPWDWAALLGSIVAAVAPAIVVGSLLKLRTKGYGVAKGIPTLIIAVAGADDALSVAAFGIIKSIMFSHDTLTMQILQGPISLIGGIGFGFLWGCVCKYIPELYDPFMVPLRILLLLAGGLVSSLGSKLIGYDGAGSLACVAAGFTCLYFWSQQGWNIEDNPAITAFEIFWMIFEPVLFGVTGTSIKIKELDPSVVTIAVGILFISIIVRIIGTLIIGIGCKLNLKEKIFVGLSWMPKAGAQAALGPIALGLVKDTTEEKEEYARKVLMVCVMSIILSAPTGAILTSMLGTKLLKKTKFPTLPPSGRRSHRPSIRDISIIDEDEEEREKDLETASNN